MTFSRTTLTGLLAAAMLIPVAAQAVPSFTITGTVRDFKDSHADFEGVIGGHETGIVKTTLGADDKPEWSGAGDTSAQYSTEANFDQWYNDVAGVNLSTSLDITLSDSDMDGVFTYSSSSFFPIDGALFGNEGRSHNYHFTFELGTEFTYSGGESFSFTGDDDVWVFINDELVVDLGGVHGAISGSVDLDTLGLTVGEDYSLDLFFAERHTSASNFKMETSLLLRTPPTPTPAPAVLLLLLSGLAGIRLFRR